MSELPGNAAHRAARADVVKTLWKAVRQHQTRTLLAVALLVAAKLSAVAVPLLLKEIVDAFAAGSTLARLPMLLLIGYAALRFSGTLLSEARDVLFARVTQSTLAEFSLRAFRHLHQLGPRFHVSRQTGAVTRDVERGVGAIGFLLNVTLFTFVPTLVEMLAVLVILLRGYSPWFSVMIILTFVSYAVYTSVFTERRARHQRACNELDSRTNSRLVDSLLNYETVKYYTNEKLEAQRFSELLQGSVEVSVRNQKALSLLHVGQSGIIGIGVAAVMLLSGNEVMSGRMSLGDLVLINALVIQLCLPLNALGFIFREARDAMINAERMFRILHEKPEANEFDPIVPLSLSRGEVRFENVDFGYDAGRQILWDVSFTIRPGGTVAVVGSSGSGKSTLARLLMRFYDLKKVESGDGPGGARGNAHGSGKILIDGQDISAVAHRSLRGSIGIVPQETILFNDTIASNIAYGRLGASREEVIEAARGARVHDFITALPDQYETMVGERGVKLSGGEKQRISIARALLKNAPILIFDEATSALDTRAERAIQEELNRLAVNRTTLIIAHRLSTVVHADEILVMEQGRIVERGAHGELLRAQGVYARMWSMQQKEQAEPVRDPQDQRSTLADTV